jgi:hypothetical protein
VIQPELPLLTAADVATLDAARDAIDRAQGHALAGRRFIEAEELGRIGSELVRMLDEQIAARRRRAG